MRRLSTVASIGHRIRAARMAAEMTQLQLANRLGLSRSQIANLEGGRGDPSLNTFVAIARVLKADPTGLLEPVNCEQCGDLPPPGFQCLSCNAKNTGLPVHIDAEEER